MSKDGTFTLNSARRTGSKIACERWLTNSFDSRSTSSSQIKHRPSQPQSRLRRRFRISWRRRPIRLRTGLVTSLARPGGNITGLSGTGSELAAKTLELIRDMLPHTRRVAVLANATDPFTKTFTAQIELAGTRSNADYEYTGIPLPGRTGRGSGHSPLLRFYRPEEAGSYALAVSGWDSQIFMWFVSGIRNRLSTKATAGTAIG